jgi:cytochrome P450
MKIQILILIIILLTFYKKYKNIIKIYILQYFIVQRGLITINCFWYNISDLLLKDSSGIELYYKLKQDNEDFTTLYLIDQKINAVTNYKFIKYIIENSPEVFSPGKAKKKFFRTFMKKNVGISKGKEWESRRKLNDSVLNTDNLHKLANKFNNDIKTNLNKLKNSKSIDFKNFFKFAQNMVAKIIFNKNEIESDIFDMFKKSNNFAVLLNNNFNVDKTTNDNYFKFLKKYINNPEDESLIKLCVDYSDNKEEILYQIPHFIFPIFGLFAATIPRTLLLLANHPKIFKDLVNEINKVDNTSTNISKQIYDIKLLRNCILETLRLNNPVITMLRTAEKNVSFKNNNKTYDFKKGEQFLILTNPILRDKQFFKNPNKFNPYRFNKKIEKNVHFISFNQGKQRCPGKELSIFLAQSFIFNFVKQFKFKKNKLSSILMNTNDIPQIINPCKIKIYY